jgi:hypothetical protein
MERTVVTKAVLTVANPYELAHDYEGEVLKLVRRQYEGLCREGVFYIKVLELTACSAPVVQTYIVSMPSQIAVQFTADIRSFNRGQVIALVDITQAIGAGGEDSNAISIQGTYKGARIIFEAQRTEGLRIGMKVAARCVTCNLLSHKTTVSILATLYERQEPLLVQATGLCGIEWKPEYDKVVDLLYATPEGRLVPSGQKANGACWLSAGRLYETSEAVPGVIKDWSKVVEQAKEEAMELLEAHIGVPEQSAWKAYA